ncbi:metal ABC transporter substrate-binding protein [Streptomyces aidingensis]|uniref:Zinc transport system substrate-binding protein n=1 Tax=Streptomyces aidingensis TaxID=910347 RepID=A0A1I1FNX7_9ACTN|nr:metal ABC transporter substrate-binding protein [Streptomyces aidingensis]SFC01249.1 zinc transport system substrate-binding protein [Streptomyces aidingensis]
MSDHRTRRRKARISTTALALGATAALSALTLTACSEDSSGTGSGDDGRLDVIASFYPMEFVAERVGGDLVSVTTLTAPGTEPHDMELTARQTASLSEADVIVYLEGIQPAVDQAIEQAGAAHTAEALSLAGAHAEEESGHGEEEGHAEGDTHAEEEGHAEEGHTHAEEEGHAEGDTHAEEESGHAEDSHDGHDHEGGDPHIWLDPVAYAAVTEGVAEVFAEADPDHAADYHNNADALIAELNALDAEYEEGLAGRTGDTFITTHAAFGHLAERYGLHEEAIAGLDPESEPSAARMQELHDIAEHENVTTVFFETLVSDETARTLAGDLGLETAVLDPLEGITEDSPGADYLEVMRANLEALRKALGADAA